MADASGKTEKIPHRVGYELGLTLDSSFNRLSTPSPFSNESFITFKNAWSKQNKTNEADIISTSTKTSGKFCFNSLVDSDSTKIRKVLGISGNLSLSYGPVSGDANVEFAKTNTSSSLDVSFVVSAKQSGRIRKNGIPELNQLVLDPDILNKINSDIKDNNDDDDDDETDSKKEYTINDFRQEFGEYVIVGFEYGGEIRFQSTYSTNSKNDSLKVEGSLNIKFGKMGFEVEGGGAGKYENVEITEKSKYSKEYSIFPSCDDPLINGKDGIIPLLIDVSKGVKKDADNVAGELDKKIQSFLSKDKLDPSHVILVPIKSIRSVYNAFLNKKIDKRAKKKNEINYTAFYDHVNPLFLTLIELKKTLDVIVDNRNKIKEIKNEKTEQLLKNIREWVLKIPKKIGIMSTISTDEMPDYNTKYKAFNKMTDEMDKKQLDKSEFYMMNELQLKIEFDEDIFDDYNTLMAQYEEESEIKSNDDSDEDDQKLENNKIYTICGVGKNFHYVAFVDATGHFRQYYDTKKFSRFRFIQTKDKYKVQNTYDVLKDQYMSYGEGEDISTLVQLKKTSDTVWKLLPTEKPMEFMFECYEDDKSKGWLGYLPNDNDRYRWNILVDKNEAKIYKLIS